MEKTITFSFQVKTKTLWQFTMYHINKGVRGIFNVSFTVAALYLLITQWSSVTDMYRLTMLFCVLIFPVWQPLMLLYKAQRQLKRPGLREPMTLVFHQEGLSVTQVDQTAEFAWDQIGRVEKKSTMIIVYMDRVHAYLIPKEYYAENEAEFAKLLHAHLPTERFRKM